MSTHPYLPLYVDDFEAAAAHLSAEEDGVYNRLLRLCWRTPGCSIPADPVWIARKIRLSSEEYDRVAVPLLTEFFRVSRGRFFQRRLRAEYENISCKKVLRQTAGKKGGAAKALKNKRNTASNANDLLEHARAFPYPEPEPESTEDKSSASSPIFADPNAEAWDMAKGVLVEQGGQSEAQAKGFFGALLRDSRLEARDMLAPIVQCANLRTPDPKSYLHKAAQQISGRRAEKLAPRRVGFV